MCAYSTLFHWKSISQLYLAASLSLFVQFILCVHVKNICNTVAWHVFNFQFIKTVK